MLRECEEARGERRCETCGVGVWGKSSLSSLSKTAERGEDL